MDPRVEAIERYLRSGEYDHDCPDWPGENQWDRAKIAHDDLLRALVAEVQKRSEGQQHHPVPQLELASWTRQKLTPMVWGLFPEGERDAVLKFFEGSVVFLTTENVVNVLARQDWLQTAWKLANIYLASLGVDLLGPEAESLVGLSENTFCYVSSTYFKDADGIEDFVIHEAAHVLHNCKRSMAGLPKSDSGERLVEIEYSKRETFAYSCEAYGWIVERAIDQDDRVGKANQFSNLAHQLTDDRVDPNELADIVREACEQDEGWQVILRRCAPRQRDFDLAIGDLE